MGGIRGTEALMADGSTKPIEDVEVGDWVWAADPETGEQGARQVTDLITGEGDKQLVDIVIDGDTVTATHGHPFWVNDQGQWIDAEDLQSGDLLLLADGSTIAVDRVTERNAVQKVHNLTVDGIHTYFVVAGDDEVLVHNCRIPGRPFSGKNAPTKAYEHLEKFHGLDPKVASNRLHVLKKQGGLRASDDVAIGRTGDVFNERTGERLGSLTDPHLGVIR